VLDGDPAPPQKRGTQPQFSALDYCGQRTGWIKMLFGTMVGLVLGNIVLDADPAPPQGATPPHFGPCLLYPKGWMDQNIPLDTKVGCGPGLIVLHGYPAPLPQRGTVPPIFRPCLLWPNGRPSHLLPNSCLHISPAILLVKMSTAAQIGSNTGDINIA